MNNRNIRRCWLDLNWIRLIQYSDNSFTPRALSNLKLAADIAHVSHSTQRSTSSNRGHNTQRGAYLANRRQYRGFGRQYTSPANQQGGPFGQFNYGRPPLYHTRVNYFVLSVMFTLFCDRVITKSDCFVIESSQRLIVL